MARSSDRGSRAALRRKTAVLSFTRFGGIEPDPLPLSGPEALSLVERLTRESWSAAGRIYPRYPRRRIPVRFLPGHPK